MALEFGPNHIRINAVCPGSVDTQMRSKAISLLAEQEGISLEDAEALETSTISLGRAATPLRWLPLWHFYAQKTRRKSPARPSLLMEG